MVVKVWVDGEQVSARVLSLSRDAARAAKIVMPKILQGSWSGASASAGTHTGGGAVDFGILGLTYAQQEAFVVELRKRNGCAWVRDPAHGWTKTGAHIHMIVRDEPDLSAGAQQQVDDYDKGLDGLAHSTAATRPYKGKDYHPRPKQVPYGKTKWTVVKRWPRTGVYDEPSTSSKRLAWRAIGTPIPYIDIVTVGGVRWLRNAAGNYIIAAATAVGK